ncbi:TonB-dependent receptor plug domain-containing protein [Pseudoalteromonas sp. JB197]|uniref:TonB-dependent receptor plug domain-containing protein n=1 Tax=Pseudoalteromonas sp. JB197 TaxID=1434839 RepID=UPI00097EEA9C|nr:TonB-dependent receptor [Pseudoalteromonas sp. JB197]PCC12682.1 TonB-dependent receptor [Pseudoalteromonas sp. JB197]SJN26260.1 TonB-dependent receptor; Outer membrane receptor for ferrienterochelin and colicins [Pseudoalteromonas sp. JB197]
MNNKLLLKLQKSTPLTVCALSVSAALLGSMYASAAEQDTQAEANIEQISVIGSRRLGRTVEDSPVPIDIIGADSLKNSGQTETNALLSSLLPSFNFPQASLTDGSDHVRPAQLRGLAPDHTLVLVNGKRRHSNALLNLNGSTGRGSSSVDLNAIPANAIARIEVLRDGAAAQYGSDAIAGVINIVLKSASSGGSVSAIYGANMTEMDGVPELKSVSEDANGNLAFNEGSDRSLTDGQTLTLQGNMGFELGDNGFLNISTEYRDRHSTNRSDYDQRENYARLDDGSVNGALDPRELTWDRYNHNFGNGNVEDFSVFYNSGYELTNNAELYSFGSYSKREGEGGGFYRLAQDDRNVTDIYPDGFLPVITSDINDFSLALGVKGFVSEWNYDVSAVYGLDDFEFGVIDSVNTSYGPSSQTRFDAGTLTYDQLTLNVDFSREVDVDFLASGLNIAVGAEYRREGYEIQAGEEASYAQGTFGPGGAVTDPVNGPFGSAGSQVFPGFTPESASDNSRHNVSLYVDLEAYITDNWNLTVAARYEDYSDFGDTLNGKIATRYTLTEDLALRASVSTGFRAPSLQQQHFTSVATVFVDGEPTQTGTFAPSSNVAKALGSPGLDAEEATNYGIGFTWSTDFNFSLSVDYYQILIDDRIVLSNNLSGAAIADLLEGTGANQGRFFLNAIDSKTRGVDVVASYNLITDNYGDVAFNLGFNYGKNQVTDIIAPPAELQGAGFDQDNLFSGNELRRFEVSTPRNKYNLSAVWTMDDWRATLRNTRYGETQDPSDIAQRNEVLKPKWITDLDVAYAVTDNVSVSLGANNIFDVYPDPTRDLVDDVTIFSRLFSYSSFSPFGFNGRYVYGKIEMRF